MILFHAADLIWATKIKGTADALGIAARPVRSVEMLEARLADSPVVALLVDLDAPETALTLIRRAREANASRPDGGPVRILAFGPHVAVNAMTEARAMGADQAVSRGGFQSRMREVLRELDRSD